MKYESDFGPALAAADRALETGSVKDVNKLLEQALRDGVAEKFQAVRDTRENAAREGTVEAQRERAEAELIFEKYVLGIYNAATGEVAHGEGGGATTGHEAAHTVEPATAGLPETAEANLSPYPSWY